MRLLTQLNQWYREFLNFSTKSSPAMKYLNVAEKNDAAKTIAGHLSNGTATRREGRSVYNKIYEFEATVKGIKCKMVMTSVSGHLLSLEFMPAYRNWKQVDPKQLFTAPVQKKCPEDFLPIKQTLEREVAKCNGLIIWTDCDREGENIGFEIIDVCKSVNPRIAVYRAKFSEITSTAVRRALNNLTQPDKFQNEAVNIRTELDLRTGAALTRLQTLRLQSVFPEKMCEKLISYGSCQIPTLGFVVERYKEVEAFVPEAFWKIKVTHVIDELEVEFHWERNRLFDKEACEDFLMLCLSDPEAKVISVTTKQKNKWRPTPMDTIALEKLSVRKLKLGAKEAMTIAEKLYSRGIISYPRTETNQFSKDINLTSLVEQQTNHPLWGNFAGRVLAWGVDPRNGQKTDQAHPPIHPTKLITDLSGNEARLYELITRHFLACVSKDARGSETIVKINIAGEKFSAAGLCIFERNYLDVYVYEKWNAKEIHSYTEGQTFIPTEISMQEGETTAPSLLTEADLITMMEKNGIGTDATHAEHINTIKERGYIGETENNYLIPGVIGMGLYEGYSAMTLSLAKPVLRAEFETDLKQICAGTKDPKATLEDQIIKYKAAYDKIVEQIALLDEKMGVRINDTPCQRDETYTSDIHQLPEIFKCPKCSVASMTLKQKKSDNNFFIGCLNYPNCKNVIWLSDELDDIIVQEEYCSRCGNDTKLLKVKLIALYYKNILSAPSGWYKTCLRCDSKFRELFNIKVDQVKNVGAIVNSSSINSAPLANVVSRSNTSAGTGNNSAQSRNARSERKRNGATERNVKNTKNNNLNVRNMSSSNFSQVQNQYNDLLNDQDDFDEIIMQLDVPSSGPSSSNSANTSANNQSINSNDLRITRNPVFQTNADRPTSSTSASALAKISKPATTKTFIDGPSCSTSTSEPRRVTKPSSTHTLSDRPSCSTSTSAPPRINKPSTTHTSSDRPSYSTSTAPKIGKLSGSLSCSNTSSSSEPSRSVPNGQSSSVKCRCGIPARSNTVRQEGPNKGKQFFSCANRENSCKFFKWDDSDVFEEPSILGVPSNIGANVKNKKKRKCGLCRKEGHTQLKCPRKTEY